MVTKKRRKKTGIKDFVANIKSEKRLLSVFAVCVLLVIVCLALCVVHIFQISRLYSGMFHERIHESSEMSIEEVAKRIDLRSDFLTAAAATIEATGATDGEAVCDTLEALSTSDMFDNIYYIMEETSTMYMPDGSYEKVDYNMYRDKISPSSRGMTVFHDAYMDDYSMVGYCFPVVSEGLVAGYVVGFADAQSRFGTLFTTEAASHVDTFLIDDKGRVLASGDANRYLRDKVGQDFFGEILVDLCDGDSDEAAIMKEDMELRLYDNFMCNTEFDSKRFGGGDIMYSDVPGTEDWSLVFILFDSTVAEAMGTALIQTGLTILALIALIIVIFVIVSRFASEEQRRMHSLEYVDELTGAPNENAFKENAKEILEDNQDLSYVIACFDILNFRYINEGYGHEKADILLKAVAKALEESLSYNETFGRIGADRFISLTVDDGRDADRVQFIDEKLADATSGILMNYPIKIKTGLYYVKNHDENITMMIDKAELARKAVDSSTRGALTYEYQEKLMESTRKQENIESRMEMALESGEFVPFLQPKWNMEENHICGAEALVRWVNPDGSIIPPNDFIPIFEKNGFIEKVDYYMLDRVCAYIRQMLDENRAVYPVSVNQSRFLLHDPEYVSRIQQILLKYKIPKNLIELEITETVFTHDKNHMLVVMNQLKDLNIDLSMDDFGSGYSSLNLLKDIPFDVLKIDRGFLGETSQSDSGKWILRSIVEMAKGLNLRVICEGVETQEHVDMLLNIGCKFAQGYKYSKPISIEEYMEKYNTHE